VLGLFMTVDLLPLFFGWPLIWPAIACESSDPFDAVSRSYSYPTQKPFHYVFYWSVILVLGLLASTVASIIADQTIAFTRWGASWGAGTERVVEIDEKINELREAGDLSQKTEKVEALAERVENATPSDEPVPAGQGAGTEGNPSTQNSLMLAAGIRSIVFWEQCIRIVTIAFNYGFFFVSMTGMYLLLRKDNDFMELDAVHVEDNDEIIPLPEIQSIKSTPEKETGQTTKDSDDQESAEQDEEPRLEEE
jgi:hypothetical protein